MLLTEQDGKLVRIDFFPFAAEHIGETPLLRNTAMQLDEYFCGMRKCFELPLQPCGTAFQMSVWEALCKIRYGDVASYKQIAESIGNPCAARAVGAANGKNPIPIIIPCHRIISADGSLGGFSGGLDIKRYLLELEHKNTAI
ncbi:MAG: methylated-DNA--[protein]-cysteine S-methyltransferase [Clostridia bacterium]